MTDKKDTSPIFGPSRRIKRYVEIEEQNDTPMPNTFDTRVSYYSDNLPEWFAPLQPIIEDTSFTRMEITLGDGLVTYQISKIPLPPGYYRTKGGYIAHLRKDIVDHGLGKVWKGEDIRYVCYLATGEFAYKDEDYGPDLNPGDSLDILINTWSMDPLQEEEKA